MGGHKRPPKDGEKASADSGKASGEGLGIAGGDENFSKEQVAARLATMTQADVELTPLGETIGTTITALLVAERLNLRDYTNSRSYCKVRGLNLSISLGSRHPLLLGY